MSFFSNAKKIWTTYAIILALLAAALGWFSYTTVRLDLQVESNRRQIELAEKQAIQRERINYALWRMDWLLTPLVAQEAARNHWMYEALIPSDDVASWNKTLEQNPEEKSQSLQNQSESDRPSSQTPLQQAYQVQVPQDSEPAQADREAQSNTREPRKVTSPLVMRSSPFVKLHFQVDENNRFSSPQVPSPEAFQMACSQGLITDKDLEFNQSRLNQVSRELQYQPLLAACSEQNLPEIVSTEMQWAIQSNEDPSSSPVAQSQTIGQQTGQQGELIDNRVKINVPGESFAKSWGNSKESTKDAPPTKGSKLTDYDSRAKTANQLAYSQRALNLNVGQTINQSDVPDKQKVVEGVMRAIWFQDKLLLARRVQSKGKAVIQCCWLDWDAIKKALLEEVEDIVPDADLIPRKNEAEVEFSRALATLPVDLRVVSVATERPKGKDSLVSIESPERRDATDDSRDSSIGMSMEVVDVSVEQPKLSPASYRSLAIAWGGFLLAATCTAWLIAGVIQLSERRSAFASAVTHELRTPLTTFRLYSEMLDGEMVSDPEQRRVYTKGLVVEADRLSRLVENVLQFSRLESKQIAFRMASMSALDMLNELLQRCRPRLASANLDCEISFAKDLAAVEVVTSQDSVEQIVFNLIDNACKYAADGKHAKIRVEAELEKRWLVVRIRDFGPGIDRQMIRRLFRPFARSSDETAGTASGVGLGLSLSRQLAKQIGGRLDYQPANPGCQFELRLPRGS